MDINARYAKYNVIKTIVPLIVAILLTLVFIGPNIVFTSWFYFDNQPQLSLSILPSVCIYLALALPFFQLGFLNNKRNLDLWYSFPIKKTSLMITQYLTGLAQLVIVDLITVIDGFCYITKYKEYFDANVIWRTLPYLLLATVAIYSISFFAFSIANNTLDGCIFIIAYHYLANYTVSSILNLYVHFSETTTDYYDVCSRFDIGDSLDSVIHYTQYLAQKITPDYVQENPVNSIIAIIIWFVVAIIAVVFAIYLANKRDASKVGDPSDSILGYKILIPIYALILTFNLFTDLPLIILVIVLLFLAYWLFRRSLIFKIPDYIVCGSVSLIYLILFLIEQSRG